MDLKAEGLWDELLDDFQPEIFIQDWWVNVPFMCPCVECVIMVATAAAGVPV